MTNPNDKAVLNAIFNPNTPFEVEEEAKNESMIRGSFERTT
jgi:hypothetical protein